MQRGFSDSAILYYANVTRFDDVVGQLLRHLEETGLRERTLIVYVADNGWDQPPLLQRTQAFDGPRGKMTAHELGVRTPIIFSWPGVVPEGAVSDALVSTLDLFPTLLDYAGAPQHSDRPGRSLRGLLQEGEPWERTEIIGRIGQARETDEAASPHGGSRNRAYFLGTRRWWYIWYQDTGAERLYDLSVDPRAARDIASLHPSRVEEFGRQVVAWREQMHSSMEQPAQSRTEAAAKGW
jgi:arylsulfatase A-like enzyme